MTRLKRTRLSDPELEQVFRSIEGQLEEDEGPELEVLLRTSSPAREAAEDFGRFPLGEGSTRVDDAEVAQATRRFRKRLRTAALAAAEYRCLALDWQGDALASADSRGAVLLWEIRSGKCRRTLEGHTGGAMSLSWRPASRILASGGGDGTIRLWDADADDVPFRTLEGHPDEVRSLQWDATGRRLVSASADGTIRIWDATRWDSSTLAGVDHDVNAVRWSFDGSRLAMAGMNGIVTIWDASEGTRLHVLHGHTLDAMSVAWEPRGERLATAGADGQIRIWDARNGRCMAALEGHGWDVSWVAWSPDGSSLASASADRTVRIWDVATGHQRACLEGHRRPVRSVVWGPGSDCVASTGEDGAIRVWELPSGRSLRTMYGYLKDVRHALEAASSAGGMEMGYSAAAAAAAASAAPSSRSSIQALVVRPGGGPGEAASVRILPPLDRIAGSPLILEFPEEYSGCRVTVGVPTDQPPEDGGRLGVTELETCRIDDDGLVILADEASIEQLLALELQHVLLVIEKPDRQAPD